jgi:hypothetical protein
MKDHSLMIKRYFEKLDKNNVTTSTAGEKIRKIAKIR